MYLVFTGTKQSSSLPVPVVPPAAGFRSPAEVIGRGVGVVSPDERFPEAEEARSGLQSSEYLYKPISNMHYCQKLIMIFFTYKFF